MHRLGSAISTSCGRGHVHGARVQDGHRGSILAKTYMNAVRHFANTRLADVPFVEKACSQMSSHSSLSLRAQSHWNSASPDLSADIAHRTDADVVAPREVRPLLPERSTRAWRIACLTIAEPAPLLKLYPGLGSGAECTYQPPGLKVSG